MKTNKSIRKRLKVTRRGKIVARRPGQNHFNAKEGRSSQMHKRRSTTIPLTRRERRRFLSGI